MYCFDVAVIGAGPAGMAAALSASGAGASTVLIDRSTKTGGILNQCLHKGFGAEYFDRELTGTEYAKLFSDKVASSKVQVLLNSFVAEVSPDKILDVLSRELGLIRIKARAVVFATGCRERAPGALSLAGERPVGVWTAGAAQRLAADGWLVGKQIVILGSGDIGVVTAKRMTEIGATVKAVIEILPYSNAFPQRIAECLDRFKIPLLLSSTVTGIEGKPRVTGVYIAKVDNDRNPIKKTEKLVSCDCLLLAVGLIPENELFSTLDIEMDPATGGAVVDECRHTSAEGFFACGNALHIHDLADEASVEAHTAGFAAGLYSQGMLRENVRFNVKAGEGVKYVLPQKLSKYAADAKLSFRINGFFSDIKVVAEIDGIEAASRHYRHMQPGKMGQLRIDKSKIVGDVVVSVKSR